MQLWAKTKALFKRKQLDRDLEDELRFHLAMREAKNRERGAGGEEARYAARRQFGNVMRVKEACREAWSFVSLQTTWRDLRYGARTLASNPGFTAVAVLATALGIGVNTGIFSVLNGVALKLLPVPRAEQIVSADQIFHGKIRRNEHGEPGLFSYSEYKNYRANNHVFSGLLAYAPFLGDVTLGGESPQPLTGAETSCNFFDVLGERPALGRLFVEGDCRATRVSPVVVLSEEGWRSRFGADPQIVGKSISLNRTKFVVIGVAAQGFRGIDPWPAEFWAPVTMEEALEGSDLLSADNTGWLALLGRMRPGVSLEEVRADLGVIAGRIDQLYPGRTTTLAIRRATFMGRPEERTVVFGIGAVVLAAVGMVLLIACANVANLLLARASSRQKEIAIRLSIGGSRGRIVRQLLTESLLIAFLGGMAGSLLAFWSVKGIAGYLLAHLPNGDGIPQLVWDVSPDLRVWGYSLALTALTGLVFGLTPALHATRQELSTGIKGDSTGFLGKSAGGGMLRSTLVGVQVAVCMVLLIAAGLLMRGLYLAQTVDPGFEMKGIVQARFELQGYDALRAQALQRELMERVGALPGVDEVEQARVMPLGHQFLGTGWTVGGETEARAFEYNVVTPGFFTMLGMPIVEGRTFTDAETKSNAPVLVVTDSTARRLWPGQNAIGKTLRGWEKKEYQVVGVVRDSQVSHLGQSHGMFFYIPAGPKEQDREQLLVHSNSSDTATINGIRETAHGLEPDLIVGVSRLTDNLEEWRTPSRIVAALSGVLGALALLLASIGVHGVVSYGVSQRIREIGIRMTLGADGRDVMSLVLRQALRPVVIGALIGVIACAAVSRVLSNVLYGIGSHDPIAFISVPLLLMGVAFLASYIPARRAVGVDPVVALRYE